VILHIVAFRFRAGTPESAVARAGDALLALRGRVPEIREIRWGPNFAQLPNDYTHVLTVLLDDMAALERYLGHPAHQELVTGMLSPIREARLALDVEVPASS
jgi:hypothetical protein